MKLLSLLRAPSPARMIDHTNPLRVQPATVSIASGSDADAAISRLPSSLDPSSTSLLIVPELGSGGHADTSPFVARAVLRHFLHQQCTIAIPRSGAVMLDRWSRLASAQSSTFAVLGSAGWVRLTIRDRAFRLPAIDAPSELVDAEELVALLRVGRAREPFEFWPTVVHPHTALRASMGSERDRLLVELSVVTQATWVLDLTPGGGVSGSAATAILAATDDIVAAELCLLAAQQLSWIRAGYEERGPWEHPRIQAACELGLGVDGGHGLVLRVERGDDPATRLAERVAWRLDCRVEE